jgi:hypothetical protein
MRGRQFRSLPDNHTLHRHLQGTESAAALTSAGSVELQQPSPAHHARLAGQVLNVR